MKLYREFLALLVVAILMPFSVLSGLTVSLIVKGAHEEAAMTIDSVGEKIEVKLQEVERGVVLLGKKVEDMWNNPQDYENLYDAKEFTRLPNGAWVGIWYTSEDEGAMYVPNRVDFNLDTKRLLGRLKNMNPSSREIISLNPYIKCMDVYLKNGISYTNTAISSDKPTYPDFQEMVDEVAESVRIQIPELLEGTPVEQIDWLIFPIADFLLRGMTLERGIIYLKLLSLVYPSISLLFPDITDSIEDYTSSFIPSDWSGSSAGTFYDQVKTSPKGKVTWGELARERVGGEGCFPLACPFMIGKEIFLVHWA